MKCCKYLQENGIDVVLLNTAVDVVTKKSKFFQKRILKYLDGNSNILALVYPNRNANTSRFQVIGVSWEKVMDNYVLDTWFLKLARVSQVLWSIQDYASRILVIGMTSTKTIGKINKGGTNMWRINSVLATILYLKITHVFGINI